MSKRLMTRTDAAVYLGIDRRTLLNWEKKGFGPKKVRTPTSKPYYTKQSLDSWLQHITDKST